MNETAKRVQDQVQQVQSVYEDQRRKVGELAKTATEKSKQALSVTDEWVHDKPWIALGVVAGVGLVLGILIAQSFESD